VPTRVTVDAAGQPRLDLRLVPLGAISGRVTDADGEPVSNALVEAVRYAYPHGKRELTTAGKTLADDRGEYRIAGVPPGRYYVRASLFFSSLDTGTTALRIRGAKPSPTFGLTFMQSAVDVAEAMQLDLPPGGELANANVQLRPDQRYTIRATVTAPQGTRVMISCGAADPRPSLGGVFGVSGSASNRPTQFVNNVPGMYKVEARDEKGTLHTAKAVRVIDADVDVALNLAPALSISGAVLVEGNAPLSRAAMRITLEAPDRWDNLSAPVTAAGTFVAQFAQPIEYRVRLANPAGGYLKSIYQGTHALATPRIDLSRSPAPLSITIGTDGAKLEGVVVDARGQPVEGAALVLVPTGPLRDWPDLIRSTNAGLEGRYQFGSIAPGA